MKKGVSLITLVITIVVIIILASISIFSSLDTIEQSQDLKKEVEFENVCTFVRAISSRAEADLIELNLSSSTLATATQLSDFYAPSGELSSEELNKINSENERVKQKNTPKLRFPLC
ncbi:MAG: hypothetical protein IJ220_00175 [Clostridia bacterium]|nr:hypothetical protein [Clostridia bacterium]